MQEQAIKKKDSGKYLEILSKIDLFTGHSPKIIKKLLGKMTQVNLLGGEVLIEEGKLDSTMYILIYGRLRVTKKIVGRGDDHVLADISPGEMVGEISPLTSLERTATVFAIRDSVLLKLSKDDYEDFVQSHLDVAYEIAKKSVLRLVQQTKPTLPGENICTIAIAPAGDSGHKEFTDKLYETLIKRYKCCVVDMKTCNEHFGKELAQTNVLSKDNQQLVSWLQSMENENDFVLLVTDRQMTPWSERCIRESDHVIFVADTTTYPSLNSIEMKYFESKQHKHQTSDLLFLHPSETKIITGSSAWLNEREISEFHHIHMNSPKHMEKVVRILTGNTLGIVFNGGGARGFAHIGILRAILEQQIPIDFVGGSSMGALIGAGWSMYGLDYIKECAIDFASNYRERITFPYIALYTGDSVVGYYQKWFGDACIEDMWTNFFCVSCNLSKGLPHVHSLGEVWRAVRMSTSIPAVFPPIYEGDEMFVDGGIVDNLPVSILRRRMKGGKVIAVNCCCDRQSAETRTYDTPSVSGWKLLYDTFLKRKNGDPSYDNIVNVILSSINIASLSYQEQMAREADYLIEVDTNHFSLLDFHRFTEIERVGYEESAPIIAELDILP